MPKGTVLSRLSRARERLRGRLARRGLMLPAGALATGLAAEATMLAAPLPLVTATLQAAAALAAGQVVAGAISAPVLALTEGVLKAMFISKIKVVTAVVLGIGLVGVGAGSVMNGPYAAGQATGQPNAAQAAQPKKADPPNTDPNTIRESKRATETKKETKTTPQTGSANVSRTEFEQYQARAEALRATLLATEQNVRRAEQQLQAAQADLERMRGA